MAENPRISYESVESMANYILSRIPEKPKFGILCGTGLGTLADPLEEQVEVPYNEIPDFPECHVVGHDSVLIFGKLVGIPTIYFKGRFHVYEGYSLDQIVLPVRLMKILEVKLIIITDIACAINKEYAIGDIMLFKDHINFVGFNGTNPLKGADERWGISTPGVVYPKDLRDKAKQAFRKSGFQGNIHEGVYVCLGGPSSETIAEMNMMKMVGADTVGMSSVHEVLAAMQCGLRVVAWSMITHLALTEYDTDKKNTEEDILDVVIKRQESLQLETEEFIKDMAEELGVVVKPVEEPKKKKKKKPCACKTKEDIAEET